MTQGWRPLWWLTLKGLLGAYRYRGPVSSHFDGELFGNYPPLNPIGRSDFKRLRQERKSMTPWQWREIESTPPPVAQVDDDSVRITWVNHSTFLIQFAGLNLLTDPVWSQRVSPFRFVGPKRYHAPGIPLEALPDVDAVLLSHNHYDHCDLATLKHLIHRFPAMRVIAPLGHDQLLSDLGVRHRQILDWWSYCKIKGVSVTLTPARHWGARSLWDRGSTLWGSFVIDTPQGNLYFGGDTGFADHFVRTRARLGPMAISLLPIGAFRPQWFMQDVHMGPAEALKAHRQLGSHVSIGCHFGCFSLANDEQDEPARVLRNECAKQNVSAEQFRLPIPGRPIVVRSSPYDTSPSEKHATDTHNPT